MQLDIRIWNIKEDIGMEINVDIIDLKLMLILLNVFLILKNQRFNCILEIFGVYLILEGVVNKMSFYYSQFYEIFLNFFDIEY